MSNARFLVRYHALGFGLDRLPDLVDLLLHLLVVLFGLDASDVERAK